MFNNIRRLASDQSARDKAGLLLLSLDARESVRKDSHSLMPWNWEQPDPPHHVHDVIHDMEPRGFLG